MDTSTMEAYLSEISGTLDNIFAMLNRIYQEMQD